ncbi:hypothetical protein TNIN_29701 [Trichonephila inaurata madagascariensis]|uniref:Uncharacterized protein n=1 Tax=Trichonephila inaurata madagascariensis TaxID=2747483 RepID=A0A8X7C4A8_9ARAC|nr:hypothetical protein TNIN_29701 [Trichonephila inaurata madagascariensis]
MGFIGKPQRPTTSSRLVVGGHQRFCFGQTDEELSDLRCPPPWVSSHGSFLCSYHVIHPVLVMEFLVAVICHLSNSSNGSLW